MATRARSGTTGPILWLAALACMVLGGPALALVPGTVDSPHTDGEYYDSVASLAVGNEDINLYTGALSLTHIDARIPGTYGLDLQVLRRYSSKITDEELVEIDTGWAGLGWQILPGGRLSFDTTGGYHVWLELPGRGRMRGHYLSSGDALYREAGDANAWPAMDSSYTEQFVTDDFTFVYRTGGSEYRAITPEGVVHVFDVDTSSGAVWDAWYYGDQIYNAHGDDIALVYDTSGQPGALSSMSDALGRTLTFTLDSDGFLDTVSHAGVGGTGSISWDYDISEATDGSGQYRLDALTTPVSESTSYEYAYSTTSGSEYYGELTLITLPTGGTVAYDYGTIDFLWDIDTTCASESIYDSRVVIAKSASADGSTTDDWTYAFQSYTDHYDPTTATHTTSVTRPDKSVLEHEHRVFSYTCTTVGSTTTIEFSPYSLVGRPEATSVYASSSATTPLSTEEWDWSPSAGTRNAIDLATVVGDPYAALTHPAEVVLPYYRLLAYDTTSPSSNYALWRVYGDATAGGYDQYGNAVSVCDQVSEPGSGFWVIGDATQRSFAWSSEPALDGWNLVRLVEQELRGTDSTASSATSCSVTDVHGTTTTTFETTGSALGWPDTVSTTATGTAVAATPNMPTTNPSADDEVDYEYVFTSTGLELSVRHGALRTQLVTYDHGATAGVGWVLGGATHDVFTQSVDASTGWVTDQTDGNGHTTDFGYDDLGRITSVTPPSGDATSVTYTPDSGTFDFTIEETMGDQSVVAVYDGLLRRVSTTTSNGTDSGTASGAAVDATVEVELDGLGRATRTYIAHDGTVGGYIDVAFDGLGRPTARDATDGTDTHSTTWTYAFPDAARKDPRGHTFTTTMGGYGDVTASSPPAGSTTFSLFDYSGDNNLVTWIYDSTGSTAFNSVRDHDQADRLWHTFDHQANSRLFVRNPAGDVVCEYDSAGASIQRSHDFAGRLSEVWFGSDSTYDSATTCVESSTADIEHFYDDPSPPGSPWTAANPKNQRVATRHPAGWDHFSFDDNGRETSRRRQLHDWSPWSAQLDTGYDSEGHVTSIALTADGNTQTVTTTWAHGRPVTISLDVDDGTTTTTVDLVDGIIWDPSGEPTQIALANGVTEGRLVDGLGRIENIYTDGAIDGSGADADIDLVYGFDGNGNVTSRDDGSTDTFTYDAIDRLTDVAYGDDSTAIAYTWDDWGNLTDRSGDHTAINFSLGAFTYNRSSSFTYDDSGNITDDGSSTVTWHAIGKPASISGTEYQAFTYDDGGRKSVVRRCTDGSACSTDHYDLFVYDQQDRLVARFRAPETGTPPRLQEMYIWLGARLLAVYRPTPSGAFGEVLWQHTDLVGSVVLATDAAAEVVGSKEPYPFGQVRGASGTFGQREHTYAGHAAYSTDGWSDFGSRAMVGTYGLFSSPDRAVLGSVADPQSFNRFAYVGGNPLGWVDPDGEVGIFAGLGGVAAAAAAVWVYVDLGLTVADVAAVVDDLVHERYAEAGKGTTLLAAGAGPLPNGLATAARVGRSGGKAAKGAARLSDDAISHLPKSAQKSIRSHEKEIARHRAKLEEFKANPTVRPGMEGLPEDAIKAQQARRIRHFETEIQTFESNIQKYLSGELQ